MKGRFAALLAIAVLCVLVVSCAPQQLPPTSDEPYVPRERPVNSQNPLDIPRQPLPSEQPIVDGLTGADGYPADDRGVWRDFLDVPSTASPDERPGIYVGDRNRPLLMGKKLGELLPRLARGQLGMLSGPLPQVQGRAFSYESFVRLDFGANTSGVLRFAPDPEDDVPRSEVFFEEGKPIVEFAYLLREGAFPLLIGSDLAFFGRAYLVADASNRSLSLDDGAGRTLTLGNGSALVIDGKRIAKTRVEMDPWHVVVRYSAPDVDHDGVRLAAGESLRQKLEGDLLGSGFDIVYDGLEQHANDSVRLRAGRDTVRLEYADLLGEGHRIELAAVAEGGLRLGDTDTPMHVMECAGSAAAGFCVRPDDEFLLTTREGRTLLLRYLGTNSQGDEAHLRERVSGRDHTVELVKVGRNVSGLPLLDGMMRLGVATYRIQVLHNGSNSPAGIDLNGDASVGSYRTAIVLADGYELRFPALAAGSVVPNATLELVAPARYPLPAETIRLRIERGGARLFVGTDANLTRAEDEDFFVGMTARGTIITLDRAYAGLGEDLRAQYPADFRAGLVRVVG